MATDSSDRGHEMREEPSSAEATETSSSSASAPLQDRLLNKYRESVRPHGEEDELTSVFRLLQQILPVQDLQQATDYPDRRWKQDVHRPAFSLPLMTNNFRRFNSRVGVLFIVQARLIRLFSWQRPTHTLSFLAIYSFLCLDPSLLVLVPLVAILMFLMVPAFLVRHPPPPGPFLADSYFPDGPPIAPPIEVRPPSELSMDFFRNLRDLQNTMDDFSRIYDQLARSVGPWASFADEELSAAVFVLLVALVGALFPITRVLPWRLMSLVAGWTLTALGHPAVQHALLSARKAHVDPREPHARAWITRSVEREFATPLARESREVEIFELQRRSPTGEWEAWLFAPTPYDPLEAERIGGRRPMGTRFVDDVQPPSGWTWTSPHWSLDLLSREWVDARFISAVEVETEGERWVSDLPLRGHAPAASPARTSTAETPTTDVEHAREDAEQWRRRRWTRWVQQQQMRRRT